MGLEASEIKAFLTSLAVEDGVSASTQGQALAVNAVASVGKQGAMLHIEMALMRRSREGGSPQDQEAGLPPSRQ